MSASEVVVVAVLVFGYSLVSRRVSSWPVSMPMVFVGAGWASAALGLVELDTDGEAIALVAEITLAVVLFSDAVRIDPRRLRRYLGLPTRLLLIGLPLTIVLGTLVNTALIGGVGVVELALVAAILAPTDAALGAAVVEDESVPARDRLTLNVESGVNDGLVVPATAVLAAIAVDEERSTGAWIGFVAEQIGYGVAIGVVLGVVAIRALSWAHLARWSDGRYEQLATMVVPVVALFAAQAVGGNAFIAAFVAGIAFGAGATDPTATHGEGRAAHFAEFTDDAAQLLALIAFFLFGNVLVDGVMGHIDGAIAVAALASLTIVRMLPVWLALVGTGLRWQSRLFLGWFGPRGLASIVFGLLLVEEADELSGRSDQLFALIGLTVVASVVLHGASAAPAATRYGRWAATVEVDAPAAVGHHVPADVMPETRWSVQRWVKR